jgi:hypothetical protein
MIYKKPHTTTQEYGWIDKQARIVDRRFYHPKLGTEITKYYAMISQKVKKAEAKE